MFYAVPCQFSDADYKSDAHLTSLSQYSNLIIKCLIYFLISACPKGSYKLIKNFDLNDLSVFRFTLDYHFAGIELLERRQSHRRGHGDLTPCEP